MQAFYVYMIRCADQSIYVGHTDDFEKRMIEHSMGMCEYTRWRQPLSPIFVEEVPDRDTAINRERQLKGWTRAKKEALVRANFGRLKGLSVSVTAPPPWRDGTQ